MALLSVHGLKRIKEGALTIEDIDFSLQKKQRIAICGETGSGKTTLLKILSGKTPFTHGELRLQGESLKNAAYELIPGHPDIAYLSQHFELRNNYKVHEELSYKNALSKENAALLYNVCRIEHLLHRKTTELSGGERQRVALARQLSSFPLLLVLDEPFSNLDVRHKQIMKAILDDAAVKMDMSYLMVSHDPLDVLSWSDYLMVMHKGKIIQQGHPETVYHRPVNEYVASMLGEYSLLTPSKYTLLSNIPAFNSRKKILLRPEYFNLTKNGSHLLEGTVVSNSFWGSYYITDVLTNQQEWIKVKTEKPVPVNESVFVSFRITQSVLL